MRERTTTVKMDEKGRLYIPKPVREALGIEGQEMNVEITVRVEEHQLQDTEDSDDAQSDSEVQESGTHDDNEDSEESEGEDTSWLQDDGESGDNDE